MGDFNKLPWQHWGHCWPDQTEADLNELHMLMLLVIVVVTLFFCNIIPIIVICFCWEDMLGFMVCLTTSHFSFYEQLGWFKIFYILKSYKFSRILKNSLYTVVIMKLNIEYWLYVDDIVTVDPFALN